MRVNKVQVMAIVEAGAREKNSLIQLIIKYCYKTPIRLLLSFFRISHKKLLPRWEKYFRKITIFQTTLSEISFESKLKHEKNPEVTNNWICKGQSRVIFCWASSGQYKTMFCFNSVFWHLNVIRSHHLTLLHFWIFGKLDWNILEYQYLVMGLQGG